MAAILQSIYKSDGVAEPTKSVMYVDTINKDGIMTEMYSYCVKYIREHSTSKLITNPDQIIQFKKEQFVAKDENDIYYNKSDGYWIVDINANIMMYEKKTLYGRFYNSTTVTKIFTITSCQCPRIVPKIITKESSIADFNQELIAKITEVKNRTKTFK
jgi:hypothetical protein